MFISSLVHACAQTLTCGDRAPGVVVVRHAAMAGRRACVGMDAHLSCVVRAMGGMLHLFLYIYQLYALENVAICNTKFLCQFPFFSSSYSSLPSPRRRRTPPSGDQQVVSELGRRDARPPWCHHPSLVAAHPPRRRRTAPAAPAPRRRSARHHQAVLHHAAHRTARRGAHRVAPGHHAARALDIHARSSSSASSGKAAVATTGRS